MTPLQELYTNATFRLLSLTWLDVLDLLLVTFAFYLLLSLLQRSRAAFLLRGVLTVVVLLLVITILLPLPTFDWLIWVSLVAILIGTPIIFQAEFRRILEQLGRRIGLSQAVRQSATEKVLPRLIRAAKNLSATSTGALIVLEGNDLLQDVLKSGVTIEGRVTSELLQTIFYLKTPLHDGAVILREERVMAAGCVLPLTERSLDQFQRRLGTRHRAGVGMSEKSDALVIIVSEETGQISVAHNGRLQSPLDLTALRRALLDFYAPSPSPSPALSQNILDGTRNLIRWIGRQFMASTFRLTPKQFLSSLGLLLVSLLLALMVWSFVIEQTDPAKLARVSGVNLRVDDIPPGLTLIASPPDKVSVLIQTTDAVLNTLHAGSFQAAVSLEGLEPGLHHLEVPVTSGAPQVRVLSVEPAALDIELAPIISQTLEVDVKVPEQESLSPAYQMVGEPVALPAQVQVTGPAPLVEQVSRVEARISLNGATTSLREMSPLRALDETGRQVTGVTLEPEQARVSVPIRRRFDALDVGVRAVISGTPPAGYWLSDLSVTPSEVTLQGDPGQLSEVGDFVDTLPVDVSNAAGNLNVDVPLNLPADVQAINSQGNPVKIVTARIRVEERSGDLAITRPVELLGVKAGLTATVNPPQVDLLLSGPLPILSQIEADPNLVRVLVDAGSLAPAQNADVVPDIVVPEGVEAQLVPPSVLVTPSQ